MSKVNPRKRPVNAADLKKAKSEAVNKAMNIVDTIHLTVLYDKFGFTADDIAKFVHDSEYLSDSILRGYCNIRDMKQVLKDEYNTDLFD